MADKHRQRTEEALKASILSDAEWSQFASEELSRYLDAPEASGGQPLVKGRAIDSHLFENDLPPDVGMLLGMQRWIEGNGE